MLALLSKLESTVRRISFRVPGHHHGAIGSNPDRVEESESRPIMDRRELTLARLAGV